MIEIIFVLLLYARKSYGNCYPMHSHALNYLYYAILI